MNEWSANNREERAKAVWARLLGCFGDALIRKFDAEPNAEWTAGIAMLNDREIERGFRRILFGWKGAPPNLPDFMRLCRAIGDVGVDEGPTAPALPAPADHWDDKPWEMAGNKYLLGHIAKRCAMNPNFYGIRGSDTFVANVGKIVAAKNAWVADMTDLARDNQVPPDTQKAVWYDYLNRAEQGMR